MPLDKSIKKVLVIGSGPIVIGQAAEFDYAGTQACRSLKEEGLEVVLLNSNPATIMTDKDIADRVYIEPLTVDVVEQLILKEKPDSVLPTLGGQAGLNLAMELEEKGFLKEHNVRLIGTTAQTIKKAEDRQEFKDTMEKIGEPVAASLVVHDVQAGIDFTNKIGYPVMLKASMGGGGKGMRLIHSAEEVEEAYTTAKSESLSSFGDDTVYLEKFVEEPHHIEFQILGDKHGNVIHLCERECSVQRRNQKIVEETPSVFVTPELRKDMGEKAVAAAKAVNYIGAGTIEFLVDKHRNYYFLEMNTRLQVEHPITEEVVGVDLVKEQIKVADGQVLQLKQKDIQQRGHAIECRICAEDTEMNFMPSPGIIKQITEPNGIGVRIDSYVYEGYEIPIYYDPMIGKLIVWATNREYAIERMRRVLHEYKLTGVKNNISYLRAIMDTPDFVEGHYDTGFITKNGEHLQQCIMRTSERAENIAMIAAYMDYLMNLEENRGDATDNRPISKWKEFGLHKGVLRI